MKKVVALTVAAGSLFLASCANYATKEYVDQQVASVSEKVNSVDAKLSALEREVAALKASPKTDAGLAAKVSSLESEVNSLKNTCPTACSDRINKLEKDVDELKEKVSKQTTHMEKEVEKSMRK
ncbi:hypothetical protein [Sulfurihydrogenibium sp.]|uniref:hypothetical protein n=1 Tax=Sulfurihydrogenibium sp. TaxID=2053621 RepID=UPI0026208A13|nr:hypothetical protein [Sulfurihydrogenibium sp.]